MCYDRDCSKKYSERNGRNSKNTAVRLESGMDAVKRLQSEKEENERLTYKEIIKNKEINAYLKKGNENLGQLGYTDHSQKHCMQVAHQAGKFLKKLGYSEHEIELAQIADYMHDVGNVINRSHHAEYGAFLANELLKETDMTLEDRVNYAVTDSKLKVNEKKSEIALNLQIDEKICSMYDYFEIFLGRMMLCRKSAEILGTTFKLTVNGRKVL